MRDPSLSPRSPKPRRDIPVPVTITLYNLLPPIQENEEEENEVGKIKISAANRRWLQFRSEYGSRLLVPVRLNIIVEDNDNKYSSSSSCSSDDYKATKDCQQHKQEQQQASSSLCCPKHKILYSSPTNQGVVHPSWDLLDERIQLLDKVDTEMQLYESMRAQIVVCETKEKNKQHKHDTTLNEKNDEPKNKENDDDDDDDDVIFLADFLLHPTKLRRLPGDHSDTFGFQPIKQNPPQMLPPNAVLVTYSDGSTRVSGSLYDLLLRNNVISEESSGGRIGGGTSAISSATTTAAPAATTHNSNKVPVDPAQLLSPPQSAVRKQLQHQETPSTQPRFDDNLFDTLDRANVTPQISRLSPTSLLFDETPEESQTLEFKKNNAPADKNSLVLPDLEHATAAATATKNLLDSAEGGDDENDAINNIEEGDIIMHQQLLPDEIDVTISDLRREAQELERMVQLEEEALREDLKVLKESQKEIKSIMTQLSELKQETRDIHKYTQKESHQAAQLEFVLETQRIKLLQELQYIYPIDSFSENRYSIRGLELPLDMYDGVVGEEEVSAALGFLCHLLVMVSKYLSIPFRYRIVCNSSRSAIQDDGRGVLPLFQARMVDREKLERGILLLGRNVDCLLLHRSVTFLPSDHILHKVKRLFDNIID